MESQSGTPRRSDDIERVLAGELSYDEADDQVQVAVRSVWRELFDADRAALDLRARFTAEGRTRWSQAGHRGHLTVHRTACD